MAAKCFLEIKEVQDQRLHDLESNERHRKAGHVQKVLSWLVSAGDDQEDFLHEIADKRDLTVCDWILNDENVSSWIEDEHDKNLI